MGWTPPTDMLTFAEIAPEQKLAVSHRGRAMGRMREFVVR
ncbi:MAG TPA: non-canonical purine NTP pyrophosphatase [Candidatus Binatia bacterium]|nr:non-canonical purine NTP pyrophosphatase [Candidatus Binatia bacterium]